jgi:hypothetical protein
LDAQVSELLAYMRSSAFRDVAGARVSARVPVSRSLLNMAVAQALRGRSTPVKAVDIRPHDADTLEAVVTVMWPFVPPLKVSLVVERQPQFPAAPQLVLRWSLLGGLGVIASRFVSALNRLPPGIRLDGDRLVLDLAILAAGTPGAAALPYVRNLQVHTVEDRLVIEADLEITPS